MEEQGKKEHFGKVRELGHGRGRGRNKRGVLGPSGFCVCAKCGHKTPHQQGIKCSTVKCSDCGHTMLREELLNQK